MWLSRLWSGWRRSLVIVKPETVLAWHRRGFKLYWRWKSRKRGPGRPKVSREVRELIRKMNLSNPGWGAPRIHGELLKLGIDVGETSVALYMVRHKRPPSQTWRTFLDNHLRQLVAVDFFVVPTLTFRILFVFVVLAHDRRRILHFNVTAHPTAAWTAQQIREAFPWDTAPRFLVRDRDGIYGKAFQDCVTAMGVEEVKTAQQSPWQNPYAERLIGSIRRECLDHVIVFNERSLRRILRSYVDYYHDCRTHLSLGKDSPATRKVQPPEIGRVIEMPVVGGLHHRYLRKAA
jgi:transposase InsO family protein